MTNESIGEKAVFNSARHITSTDERRAYLQQVCGHDPDALHRILDLLRIYDQEKSFLESPLVGRGAVIDHPSHDAPGSVIGPYKLLEEIGEGGFGVVFLAEQTQPVRRKVALKILKPGMDTRQVVARFEAERQALALMDHPNIARILDAGAAESGRPYFVMELVKGVPITDYCDQHRLTPRQRLDLFATVCQAVQHAHQKGIIHRDLKPSNVLVTLHDTVAVPKVIDFGIAKATGQQLTDKTLFTHFAQLVGTPLYMSPEQAEMNGLDVDTRSDVYALGVLLYELLTGVTPFEAETLRKAGLDEVRRIIREEEPPRPSHRVGTLGDVACTTVSDRRGVDGRQLSQMLSGELDWIVMRCLEKDRNRRYESASALAADVRRYLSDEPVEACPPSAGYRLLKFARRNRRALVTAGVIAMALVTATAVSAWQAVVARDAQHQAEIDRDRAEASERQAKADQEGARLAEQRANTEAAIARAVNEFFHNDLLRQAGSTPQSEQEFTVGPYLTVKEALDRAGARIGERFQDQPLVEAAIRNTIGEAYISLFEYQPSLPHLERAFALRKAQLGPDHLDTLDTANSLATAAVWQGRHTETIALRQQILASREARLGPDHPDTLTGVHGLAHAYWSAGQRDKGERMLELLVEKQRALLGPTHVSTIQTMHLLGMIYHDQGRLDKAIALHEKVLELRKATLGPDHVGTYPSTEALAQVYQQVGKLEQAEHMLREALELCRKNDNNPRVRTRTANALGWLARALLLQRKFDEAEPLIREAVAIFEKYQPESIRRYYWTSLWGDVLLGQKKYEEAEPLILNGHEGTKQREHIWPERGKSRVAETGERVVRYFEATGQQEKARQWREKLSIKQR